jgi:gamma-glutamyltranspeptidase/glutathione hydrolase
MAGVACSALARAEESPPVYANGAVATGAPIATRVGTDVLNTGGNAFDAAVAVGFALAVVHPQAGNIGGGGFAVLHDGSSGVIRALDFRETAPLAAHRDMYLDDSGAVVPRLSLWGAKASGTPGTVAGLYELWAQHASMPWEALVLLAADVADTGFVLDDGLAESLTDYRESLTHFPATAEIFFPEGRQPAAGDRLIQAELGRSLRLIAERGRDGFYVGETAERIERCMQRHGGLITKEDLARYQPVWREPTHTRFDGLDIYSMPPPSSGGIIVGQILKLLEPYDLTGYSSQSPEYIHLFTEAARLAFADRAEYLGDPDFCDIPTNLVDDDYLDQRRELIVLKHAGISEHVKAGRPARYESDQTTHYSICDNKGNMVAVTYTLNSSYGCKLVVEGAGFLLNNQMDDFSIKPGVPNIWGLIGGEANSIQPGKRMLSSMAPSLLLKDGQPRAIIGTPGGSKIITVVAQAILNLTRFQLSAEEICSQPHFHHQWLPDVLYFEEDSFNRDLIEELAGYGHTVKERSHYGDLQIILIDEQGHMTPASDTRGRGASGGVRLGFPAERTH